MNKLFNKLILVFLFLFSLMFNVKYVSAVSANVSLSASSTNVSIDNTITITVTVSESGGKLGTWSYSINHDSSKLSLVSGSEYEDSGYGDGNITSKTYTLKYKAIAQGTSTISVTSANVYDWDSEQPLGVNKGSVTINVTNTSSSNSSSGSKSTTPKNSDNSLKSLGIEGATLSPEFNKDTLEYSAEFPSDTTKVMVNAEKNDSKASISGTGEKEVAEGTNKLEIVVTAENGSTKTYVINAIVAEKDPIEVKVDGKEYTVIRKKDVLEAPEGYTETTVLINDEEIPAYTNEKTGYLLVGLNNSKGESSWYIYDKNKQSYKKYIELKSDMVRISVLKPNKKDIPYKYYKSTFEFNQQMIDGYTFDENSDFRLVYGMNIETGEKSFYVYDTNEKTIQRFYNEQALIYIELVKKIKYLLIGVGACTIILFILLLISLSKNAKFKKKYLSKIEQVKKDKKELPKEEVKYKDIEATRVMNKIDEEQVPKKKIKNKKREKTFLDE